MNFPFMPAGDFIVPSIEPNLDYLEGLRHRKAVISRLCTALHEFLTLDIDLALERATLAPKFKPRKPTIEDLERAQQEVEKVQRQIEALEKMADTLPEETADYVEQLQRPMLESQLQSAQQWLSTIQKAMEATDAPPAQEPS